MADRLVSVDENYMFRPPLEARLAAKMAEAVDVIEPRIPAHETVDGVLFAVTDEGGSETWLGARASDGGPTSWAMEHVRTRLGIESNTDTEYLYAVADKDGRATDLSVRLSDGQVPDWVLVRWAKRLALSLGTGGFLPSDRYVRDGELLPVTTDMTRMAGWGSSSMQGFGARLAAPLGVNYINGGKAGEQSQHIAARLGSRPALLTFPGNQIPASGATTVTSSNVTPNVSMLTFSGTVAGVHGSLSHMDGAHVFTRTTAGTAISVSPDAPFLPDQGLASRDAVTLLWMGKNDFSRFDDGTEKTVIERTDAAFDWLAPMTKRVLVLGHFVDDVTPVGTVERKQIYATNAAHAARYGDLFVDIDKFLTTDQVWNLTGLTPTAADLEAQATGNKPPSLSNDAQHLNAAGYEAVKMLLIQRFNQLGWYSTTTA